MPDHYNFPLSCISDQEQLSVYVIFADVKQDYMKNFKCKAELHFSINCRPLTELTTAVNSKKINK